MRAIDVGPAEREAFWPSRRLDAFDGLCPPAALRSAAGPAAPSRP